MEGMRFGYRAYEDVMEMDVFRKIASAIDESLETVCQMQEEERNNLKIVLGLQKEEGDVEKVLPRVGNKRKALPTFEEEESRKRFASDRRQTSEEMPELLTRSSRVAAKKANLKFSEINKILENDDANTSNDSEPLIEDFVDHDEKKEDVVSDNIANRKLDNLIEYPDLMRFVKRPEDILKEDLPELELDENMRKKFKPRSCRDLLAKHSGFVEDLTRDGLRHGKISEKSWTNIQIVRQSRRETKNPQVSERNETLTEDIAETSGGPNDNIEKEKKTSEPPAKKQSKLTLISFKRLSQPLPSTSRENGRGFMDDGDSEIDKDSPESLFDQVRRMKKTVNGSGGQPCSTVNGNSPKSDDDIQFVKEVKSPQVPSDQRLVRRVPRKIKQLFGEAGDSRPPVKRETDMVDCPLCSGSFSSHQVEEHAATCEGSDSF